MGQQASRFLYSDIRSRIAYAQTMRNKHRTPSLVSCLSIREEVECGTDSARRPRLEFIVPLVVGYKWPRTIYYRINSSAGFTFIGVQILSFRWLSLAYRTCPGQRNCMVVSHPSDPRHRGAQKKQERFSHRARHHSNYCTGPLK